MDGNKYDVSEAKLQTQPPASLKPILDDQKGGEGEQEKMLDKDESKLNPTITSDALDVKYSEKNGDAKLDIGDLKAAFVGMGKEELMKYANDPFWVRLRWFLFILFWLLWAGMLVGAIMIIYAAPKCEPAEVKSWWQQGPLSKIDESATESELKELKNKGIQGVIVKWPFDPYSIALNDSQEFKEFLDRAKKSDVNVIVELKPGTSRAWFNKSENRASGYDDYYIWAKGGANTPPNNWLSPNDQSAWLHSAARNEYYYARDGEPNLNFRNPKVIDEFSTILTSFLSAGVQGVRLAGVPYLLVNETLRDEPPKTPEAFPIGQPVDLKTYKFYVHSRTENLQDLGPLLKTWRGIVKGKTENGPFFLSDDLTTLEPYKVNGSLVIDLPRQSQILLKNDENVVGPAEIVKGLNVTFRVLNNTWPLWEHTTDVLPDDVLDVLTFLLPGVNLVERSANISRDLLNIRNTPSIMDGNFTYYTIVNETVLAYIRAASGHPSILVALNPTDEEVNVDFPKEIPVISDEVTVKFVSRSYVAPNVELKVKKSSNSFPMSAKSAVVLSYVPKSS